MVIMNASMEEHSTKVFGRYHKFKPEQIKIVSENLGRFLVSERRGLGFVALPEEFEDPEFRLTDEGKEILEERKSEGVRNRIQRLTEIARNNSVSLKMDLRSSNIQTDPRALASKGELSAMRQLVEYRKAAKDTEQAKIDEIEALEKELNLSDETESI